MSELYPEPPVEASAYTPDIEALADEYARLADIVAVDKDRLQSLRERVDQTEESITTAQNEQSRLINEWLESLLEAPSLYAASYYLDKTEPKNIDRLHELHDRGRLFFNLNEHMRTRRTPVMITSERTARMTSSVHEATTGANVVIFNTVIGYADTDNPIEVVMDRSQDVATGAVTETPTMVNLNLAESTKIWSRSMGFDGEEWLLNPAIGESHEKPATLLRRRDTGRLPAYLLSTLGETQIDGGNYIYIGGEVIQQKINELQARLTDRPHDNEALNSIVEISERYS